MPGCFPDRPTVRARRILLHPVFALTLASIASAPPAAAYSDQDGDLLRFEVDNCAVDPNGPNQASNQVDSDADGYGNRCDADYDQSGTTTALDFGRFLQCFGATPVCRETDHDGSGTTTALDFGVFLGKFSGIGHGGNAPGPSGLACAGHAPCRAYARLTLDGAVDTPGLPNDVASPTDFDVVLFTIPPGYPGQLVAFQMMAGAPGGLCSDGVHCYAEGRYFLAGWPDATEAEASPLLGTLFHFELTDGLVVRRTAASSDGGIPGNPRFPLTLLEFPILPDLFPCPESGCVVALISDVSQAPGLVVETRTSNALPPTDAPVDHGLCPIGCEGTMAVGTAAIELLVAPLP
ncbi:MAG: hypothetical protein R3F35_00855 [Myxococcota bacterium]